MVVGGCGLQWGDWVAVDEPWGGRGTRGHGVLWRGGAVMANNGDDETIDETNDMSE